MDPLDYMKIRKTIIENLFIELEDATDDLLTSFKNLTQFAVAKEIATVAYCRGFEAGKNSADKKTDPKPTLDHWGV